MVMDRTRTAFLGIVLVWTLAILGPADASAVTSDDFNVCALNTSLWTITDPIGTSTVTVGGAGTENAQLVISIPAGASHDVWTTYNDTVRLMQPAPNVDFEVQVKFDSLLTAGYQMQGILVEQDAGRFLRYDIVHSGSSVFLFSATFAGGSAVTRGNRTISNGAPFWMSVKRVGDQWTLRYSYDGQNWLSFSSFSFAMTVARIGPFAGNWSPGTAPAVTSRVDYVLDVASPFTREDGPLAGLTLTTAVTGQGTINVNPLKQTYACGEQVTVTAVPAAGWQFQSWSGDLTGTQATQTINMVAPRSIRATFVQGTVTPLQITNVAVAPSSSGAAVTWTTNNAASSRVRYGPTTAYELGEVRTDAFKTSHSVQLTGLSPATTYHYAITCTDQYSQVASTPDATFVTTSASTGVTSDDFNATSINTQLWTIMNPSGQATFRTVGTGTANARLEVSMPAGVYHEAWTNGIYAPWVKQQVPNANFGVEAKFDSEINRRWQVQGIIVQQDDRSFIRADFYADNAVPHLYVATFANGSVRQIVDTTVPAGAPYYMRVTRSGNQWSVQYSKNGQTWSNGASFNHTMTVTGVGPYFANEGSPAPSQVGLVDYFFNTASPILDEDGQQGSDTTPPTISSIQTIPHENSIDVIWVTDEPADSAVAYGQTTNYELGTRTDANLVTSHAMTLTGLAQSTTYNLKIFSADASGNEAQSNNIVVTTTGSGNGPQIDVWYGNTQYFGHIGTPIPMINVLGNVWSSNGVTSLSYSLNGGAYRNLSLGPNTRRLAEPGDFNVEVFFTELQAGANSVRIRARDALGQETFRDVSVINSRGPVWPLSYTVNWSGVGNINDVAQVVDGIWSIQGNTVRPDVMAYDRLIAIGDQAWTEYEVSCPVTVHSIDPNGYAAPSYGPGVGLLLRWPGHSYDGGQPWQGVYPLGAIGMFRWTNEYNRFQLFGNNGYILASSTSDTLQLGVQYIFKMRVANVSNRVEYSYKWWRANQGEPSSWQLTGSQSKSADPGYGCVLLLAHHVDASFGAVTVTPLQ